MRNLLKTLGVAAVAGLMLASCASVAHVEKDDNVNLNNYRSFSWVETKESKGDSASVKVSDLTERRRFKQA